MYYKSEAAKVAGKDCELIGRAVELLSEHQRLATVEIYRFKTESFSSTYQQEREQFRKMYPPFTLFNGNSLLGRQLTQLQPISRLTCHDIEGFA